MIRLTFLAAFASVALIPSLYAQSEVRHSPLAKLFKGPAEKAGDSTVRVRCNSKDAALGTVMDAKGYILTKGSEILVKGQGTGEWKLRGSIGIRMRDGSEYDAEYVGYHEKSDLALLKIDSTDLVPVKLLEATKAETGNMVAAPGLDSEPHAAGIISAGVRKLYEPEDVIRNGNKGYLGVLIDQRRDDGVFLSDFSSAFSPASRAKMKVGDEILSINGKAVDSFKQLSMILDEYKPGDKVKVMVRRRSKDKDETEELGLDVKLGSEADSNRGAMQNSMGSTLSGRRTGFPQVITTDMVIQPTDCGGPLVDLEGRVVGITIARAGRVESWVLPKEVIVPVFEELRSSKVKKQQ
jgi:serine protease Do